MDIDEIFQLVALDETTGPDGPVVINDLILIHL